MSKNKEYIASGDKDGLINIWKVVIADEECGCDDFINSSESPKRRQNQ